MLGLGLYGTGVAGDVAPPPPPVALTANIPPAMGPLFSGQAITDMAGYGAMTAIGNFSSSAGAIVSAVVGATGDATGVGAALTEGEAAGFEVLVTDDQGNSQTFPAGLTTVEYGLRLVQTVGNEAELDLNPNAPNGLALDLTIEGGPYAGVYAFTAGDIRGTVFNFPGTAGVTATGFAEGDVLNSDDGLWSTPSGAITLTRVWRRNGALIPGATGPDYTLTASDIGTQIRCDVTGDDGINPAVTVTGTALQIGAGGFDPVSLFAGGAGGAYYVMNAANMRAAVDGSGGVPAIGTGIGFVEDLSGNGNHARQGTAGARPLLESDAAGDFLQCDGSNDELELPALGIQGSMARSLFVVGDRPTGTINASSSATGQRWTFVDDPDGSGNARIEVAGGAHISGFTTGALAVYGIVLDGATLGDHVLHKNDATEASTGTVTINTQNSNYRMGRRHTSQYRSPAIRAFLIIDRALTGAEISNLKAYFYAQYGITG